MAEAEAKVAKQRMFLGAAASMVEEQKFESLLKGKARKANALQSEKKIEQVVWERTMAGKLNSEYRMFGKKRGNKLKRMSWRSEICNAGRRK